MSVPIFRASADRPAGAATLSKMCASALIACLSTVATWIARRAERRALRELAAGRQLLNDVDLTREQLLREGAKPFRRG